MESPAKFETALLQNYPNPASGITRIGYRLSTDGTLKLTVCNLLGTEVALLFNGHSGAGYFSLPFQTNGLPAGVYFYRMIFSGETGTVNLNKKMIIQ